MAFNMKGSPAKMGGIQGTAAHSSALKMKAEANAASALKQQISTSNPYAEAKKKDPKLDEYIKIQKSTTPGSKEYEDNQALINKAYGKERDQKLKKAQIKNVKKQEVKDKETAKNATERAKDEKGNTKKRDSIVKDENKDGNMLTRAVNRLKKGVKVKKASSDKQKQRKADREEAKKQGISVWQLKKNRKK